MNKKLSILFSVIVLSVGSYLIVKDFHKEQIKIWDEASSAKNAVDMYVNNNFIVQYDDGEPVRDDFKPPLSLWLKMICYHFFGINEFSVRLPSIIAALLTMLVLWYFGFFVLKRPELGILFALLLISSRGYVFYHVSRTGDPDALLVFFITLSVVFLYQLINKYPEQKSKYFILLGVSILLAMYTKGIMGLVPLAGFGVYALITKNGRQVLSDYRLYLTGFVALAFLIAYYVLREHLDPGYIDGVLKYEVFSFREAPGGYIKHPEFSFYIKYLLNHGFKPFMYILPISLPVYLYSKDNTIKNLIKFTFWGCFVFLLGMSFATLKNEWYIAPVYPIIAIYAGSTLIGVKELVKTKTGERYRSYADIVFVLAVVALCANPVRKIDRINHYYKKSVYNLEREGRFFRNIKEKHPDILNVGVIIPHHTRQLEFYIKKYRYIDGTATSVYKNIPEEFLYDTVIVCDEEKIIKLSDSYLYEIIDTDEYCMLIELENLKGDNY